MPRASGSGSGSITKLLGPTKWTYLYLYVMLDVFSRYVVGWMVAHRESATLAERFIHETCAPQEIGRDHLTIRGYSRIGEGNANNSIPMSKRLDLSVSRPRRPDRRLAFARRRRPAWRSGALEDVTMEPARLIVATLAVVISIASFIIAQRAAARAKRAEAISHLLGEKETVAFAALKLLRDGLPANGKERALVLAALLQACVFEGSDRARALLYRVIELHRATHREELRSAMRSIKDTFVSMDLYGFQKDELDLDRGKRRLASVDKVVETP